jgi:hypothetical protein
MKRLLPLLLLLALRMHAQEAASGFDLRATVTGLASRFNESGAVGVRSILYPLWKLNEHWTVSAALQSNSRPGVQDSAPPGLGFKGNLLQASLNYSQFWRGGSVSMRVGQLTTAFGSYPLRYDDADNPLIGVPLQYGYAYTPVSTLGLAGIQLDLSHRKWDARAQFVNSSPANPRSLFSSDQYGNWAGGIGYTPVQGFRMGVSTFRGPYLDRHSRFYFPGEAPPRDLPAQAYGLDVQWARSHWNLQGEFQRFRMDYRAIPSYLVLTGYIEAKRVLRPRWYIAFRQGFSNPSAGPRVQAFESVAGFRPNRHQLIKFGYGFEHDSIGEYHWQRTLSAELVTTIHPLSRAIK